MAGEINTIQNRIRIKTANGWEDFYFKTDTVPQAGSTNPITSGAVAALEAQLSQFKGRSITHTNTLGPHSVGETGTITNNDVTLVSTETLRYCLDALYQEINSLKSRVKTLEGIHDITS